MSGGEQQLLEMAMAVLRRPEILLVDEPSVGLSPQAITLVFNELKRLHQGGRTILLVEQNTRKAMEAAEARRRAAPGQGDLGQPGRPK